MDLCAFSLCVCIIKCYIAWNKMGLPCGGVSQRNEFISPILSSNCFQPNKNFKHGDMLVFVIIVIPSKIFTEVPLVVF